MFNSKFIIKMGIRQVFRLFWIYKKTLFVILVPLVFLPLPLVIKSLEAKCGYVLLVMALYWTTEVLPLSVTALLPVVFLPLLGVMTAKDVASNYIKDTNMMLIGSLTVALAIEKCNLHRRIALGVLRVVGAKPQWLMAGFMLPTWFLSMWISNTATTAMMIPVVEAVLQELEGSRNKDIPGLDTHPPENNNRPSSIVHSIGVKNEVYVEDDDTQEDVRDESRNKQLEINGTIPPNLPKAKTEIIVNDKPLFSSPQGMNDISKSPSEIKGTSLDIEVRSSDSKDSGVDSKFSDMCKAFTLCICYAANAGGTATLTGTPPNLILKGQVDELWQSKGIASPINFSTWIVFALPSAVILLLVTWAWLVFLLLRWRKLCGCCSEKTNLEKESAVKNVIKEQYRRLGPIRFDEASVGIFFILLVFLWFFRQPEFIPGWSSLFRKGYTADGMPALFILALLYIFPSRPPWKLGNESDAHGAVPPLMKWSHFQSKMPWGIVLLLGGGFALARACQVSGLSDLIADRLSVFRHLPGFVMVFLLCFMVSLLTEVTSNAATATILLPIMASLAESIGKNPLYLMLPVTISTSFAYMLPVATPPNAIAFSFGRLKVPDMVKAGAILNVVAVVVVSIATHTWGMRMFDFNNIPWTGATNTTSTPWLTATQA